MPNSLIQRLRWSGGERADLWYPSSRVQTRPKPSDFSGEKILSAPSFGGEVNPSVPCRKFTACKRTQKWRGSRHFRHNSRQFLAYSSTFRCWGSLASFQTWGAPGGESWNVLNHWSSKLGGLTCHWQRQSVKTFLLRILNNCWAGHNPKGLQCRLKKKKNSLIRLGWIIIAYHYKMLLYFYLQMIHF